MYYKACSGFRALTELFHSKIFNWSVLLKQCRRSCPSKCASFLSCSSTKKLALTSKTSKFYSL